jgi:type IV pilus assembly protein PilB
VVNEVGSDGELKLLEEHKEDDISLDQLRELVDDAPIIQLVNMIIRQALADKASDIHIQPEANSVRIRYRIDGMLQDGTPVPKAAQAALVSRIKVMADMDIALKRVPQDGRISLTMNGREYDMRVSSLPNVQGEKIVMRVLDKSGISVTLSKLGFPTPIMAEYDNLIHRSYGIILVTGPTGSGKSTTLYATLNQLNSPEKNILTVEDPVEYQLPGLTQSMVNVRAGLTFPAVLRTMLRQDPDIILVGETRDGETALIATEAALTGHLVFSTLHTNDAPGAISRLMEMGIEPFLISSSLAGVLAQRLVRSICPRCKEDFVPSPDALRRMNLPFEKGEVRFYRGAGCQFCRNTGYKGRVGVFELMKIDNEIREMILDRAPTHVIRQSALDAGMMSLKHDAMQKILEGITTIEEALRVIYAE